MTQLATHPLHVSNLLVPALSGVVGALSDRGGSSIPEYDARAQESWRLIQSFRPRDSIDLMLVGQLIAFHEILADGTRDLLRGMAEPLKHRTRSGLVAIGRLCLGYADRLDKRELEARKAAIAAQEPEQAAPPPAQNDATPPDRAPLAASPTALAETPAPALDPRLAAAGETPAEPDHEPGAMLPAKSASRADEASLERGIETPAILAARASVALRAMAAMKAAVPAAAPAKAPVTQPGAKGWYVDVGASSIESAEIKAFPPLSPEATLHERNGAARGD